jgi:hypothetical protein
MTVDEALTYAKEKGFELYLLFGEEPLRRHPAKAVLRDIAASKAGHYYSTGENQVTRYASAPTKAAAIIKAVDDPDWPSKTVYVPKPRPTNNVEDLDL